MAKKKAARQLFRGPGERPTKRVLVVDHGSAYTSKISEAYDTHTKLGGPQYDLDVKTKQQIDGMVPDNFKQYDIVHLSGSMKRKLSDESNKKVLDNVRNDAHVIGTCYGAQVIADYHKKGEDSVVKKLDKYQRSSQEIKYKGGKTQQIHKAHSWGIPDDKDKTTSHLEAIATSKQKFAGEKGKKDMLEVFKVENKRHFGIQGHAEKRYGGKKENPENNALYDLLTGINEGKYTN